MVSLEGTPVNLTSLGDAVDHWKGSIFAHLQECVALRDFAVDPMARDIDDWSTGDFELYARLLRIRSDQILEHRCSLACADDYFGEITHSGDLFLDADAGVLTGGAKDPRECVPPAHLGHLLCRHQDRVVAVYQQVGAETISSRVDCCLAHVAAVAPEAAWCCCESGSAAMLFFSVDTQWSANICRALRELLGLQGERRVRFGALRAH